MEPNPMTPAPARDPDVEDNKDLAAFAYVWIFSILVYFAKRDSKFVRFHAKQGMILFVLSIVVWFIPFLGKFFELLVLFGAAWGFIHAAQGKWEDVPFVGPLSRGKLAFRSSVKKTVEGVVKGVDQAKEIWKEEQGRSPPPPQEPTL